MEERGWHVDRLQRPEGLHAMVTPAHQQVTEKYLEDLKASVEIVRLDPKLGAKGNAAMYGMIANMPFRKLIKKEVMKMMEKMYGPECEMPLDEPGKESLPIKVVAKILNKVNWLRKK